MKINYDTAVRQLVKAKDAAKKALEAQWVLMEKKIELGEKVAAHNDKLQKAFLDGRILPRSISDLWFINLA